MVTVIIVNWNAVTQLRECVHSCLTNVKVVRAGGNLGFGKGCNQAAAYARDEYLLFLNPDACLFPNSLAQAVGFIEKTADATVGICGVQLIDEDGRIARSCARFPSAAGFVAHALGVDRIFSIKGHFMREWDHLTTRQVDHVIGAFFLIRRNVFDALQGFDERFFLYLEDLDFSYRARRLGWSSVYFAGAQAFHAGGGTSRQVKAKRLFYSLRSRILYAFKHFNTFEAMLVLVATLVVEPMSRTVLAVSRCSWSSVKETYSAYGMLFRWLPRWILNGVTR